MRLNFFIAKFCFQEWVFFSIFIGQSLFLLPLFLNVLLHYLFLLSSLGGMRILSVKSSQVGCKVTGIFPSFLNLPKQSPVRFFLHVYTCLLFFRWFKAYIHLLIRKLAEIIMAAPRRPKVFITASGVGEHKSLLLSANFSALPKLCRFDFVFHTKFSTDFSSIVFAVVLQTISLKNK